MTVHRLPPAAPPPRRIAHGHPLPTVDEVVAAHRPDLPLYCIRPQLITETVRRFVAAFPGPVLYAVKCNPEPTVLRAIAAGGVHRFDVASPAEIALTRKLFPAAELHFMHPVKSRSGIAEAYRRHGVRSFALDSLDELAKIRDETGGADDLTLMVRLAVPKGRVVCDLSGKFGAGREDAVPLLRAARSHCERLGVSFHVGSQCIEPAAYDKAMALVGGVIAAAGIGVEVVDVGGGFPVDYPGSDAPPLDDFIAAISAARRHLPAEVDLWAEPGRALVATGGSLVVRVELRRGSALYVTDGVYGGLHDAGRPLSMCFPTRLIRPDGQPQGDPAPFQLFGPTCDSADALPGPFLLPDDVAEGDWIEIGLLGAYGASLRTGFNGFAEALIAEVIE
jgi:ornithine decarboxylase